MAKKKAPAKPAAAAQERPVIEALDRFIGRMLRSPEEKIGRAETVIREKQAEVSVPRREGCCTKTLESEPTLWYEVNWSGVFTGFSGYAKAGKEIVLRLANTFRVHTEHSIQAGPWSSIYDQLRMSVLERVPISPRAPHVRFFGPSGRDHEKKVWKINYTMMETEQAHPDMVDLMNTNYQEIWTPTVWNRDVFERSGVKLPIRVMPLGVDPWIYRPGKKEPLPPATLLTTERAGTKESPKGFVFVYVFLPSFRKGLDLLVPAFERAFSGSADVSLVLAITHAGSGTPLVMPKGRFSSRIYTLQGEFDELALAKMYRGCDAYVCPSKGEGWNLPLVEAAACGLPVIATHCTAHPEVLGDEAFYVHPEGAEPIHGADVVSAWYEGMPFPKFGKAAEDELVDLLRHVRTGGSEVRRISQAVRERIVSRFTWGQASATISDRLSQILMGEQNP